jgi:hypothetical protein
MVSVMDQKMLDEMDAANRKTDYMLYKLKQQREERERQAERDKIVVTEYSVPVPKHRQSEIWQSWVEQKLDAFADEVATAINRGDVELGEELIDIITEGMNKENRALRLEIDQLRSQLEQLKAEITKDRMIAKGELTVLPPFIKGKDVA